MCRHRDVPAETLDDGRFRCANCNVLFTTRVAARVRRSPAAAAPIHLRESKEPGAIEEAAAFLTQWKKPLSIAAGSLAVLLLAYFFFPANLFGRSGRVAVYAVQGKIEFEGKAIPNAAIYLHPIGETDPQTPRPRGTAREDGSFVLGTYGNDDGAPAGEYKVTVQWYKRAELKDADGGRLQKNLLQARYAAATTSGLTVEIRAGENQIPVIKLKR